eukprot:3937550-Rhodomonas_salina.2
MEGMQSLLQVGSPDKGPSVTLGYGCGDTVLKHASGDPVLSSARGGTAGGQTRAVSFWSVLRPAISYA